MNDPREILAVDPYNNITSDEEDEQAIARELEFMERKRQALVERLKESKNLRNPRILILKPSRYLNLLPKTV